MKYDFNLTGVTSEQRDLTLVTDKEPKGLEFFTEGTIEADSKDEAEAILLKQIDDGDYADLITPCVARLVYSFATE